MICRIWRGWTTRDNAAAYEAIVRGEVILGIEARRIAGFRHIDLLRHDSGQDEVEFTTLMWFDNEAAIADFVGPDSTVAHVPAAARALLSHFDDRSRHFTVIERRPQF
jgi:heme-degrading monooxygenase HmoA